MLLLCFPFDLASQVSNDSSSVRSRYYEDQFYLGITYNFLLDQPEFVSQRNFSYGMQAGFIKDIPINYDGTVALGVGLGLGLNAYYSNIKAEESLSGITYATPDIDPKRSKLETHLIEFPVQFRWRNSNATEYKFWRIYTGVKFAYVAGARSKFIPDENDMATKVSFTNNDVRKFQYGITFDFGYSSFNAHVYYALTNLFNDDAQLNGSPIEMRPLRVGLIFYIL